MNLFMFIELSIKTAFFGNQDISVWLAGLVWSFVGILGVKIWFLQNGFDFKTFSFKYWINDNLVDILKGLMISIVMLRLEDYGLSLLKNKFQINVPESADFVMILLVLSALVQIRLHKKRTPLSKSMQDKMHTQNATVDPDKEEVPSEKG